MEWIEVFRRFSRVQQSCPTGPFLVLISLDSTELHLETIYQPPYKASISLSLSHAHTPILHRLVSASPPT